MPGVANALNNDPPAKSGVQDSRRSKPFIHLSRTFAPHIAKRHDNWHRPFAWGDAAAFHQTIGPPS
jgi:hypothetical protein